MADVACCLPNSLASDQVAVPPLPKRKVAEVVTDSSSGDVYCKVRRSVQIVELPEPLLQAILATLTSANDLARLECTLSKRQLQIMDSHWYRVTKLRWPAACEDAMKVAGSWRAFYAEKHVNERAVAPWAVMTNSERVAAVMAMTQHALNTLYLLDTSGSVTEEDYAAGTGFIKEAVEITHRMAPDMKVGVVQFSNEARAEVEVGPVKDLGPFNAALDGMVRMNGGTNLVGALNKAGNMLRALPAKSPVVVCLLTDGRVDSFQAREAVAFVERMAAEFPDLTLYAFGIGRGVDEAQLNALVQATNQPPLVPSKRYFGLRVLDQAMW